MCESSRKNNLPLARPLRPYPFGFWAQTLQVEAHQRYTLVMDIAFILLHRLLTIDHGPRPGRDLVNRPPKFG